MEYLELINGNEILIVSFSSCAAKLGRFEFYNFFWNNYNSNMDLCFYQDMKKIWYHEGVRNLSNNIEETTEYLKNLTKKYIKVIFLGISSGGYAAILFGSLCKIDYVIAIIPQVTIKNPINKKYKNLKKFIYPRTKYILFGNSSYNNKKNIHSIKFCHYLNDLKNVYIFEEKNLNIKNLVNNGRLYKLLKSLILN